MTIAERAAPHHAALSRARLTRLSAAGIVLAVAVVVDLLTGPAFLSVPDVLRTLVLPDTAPARLRVIVWDLRLPLTLMAIMVGVALGVAGTLMQTMLGNPLASPYTLGFSAAAGFGASLTILTGVSLPLVPNLTIPLAAIIGCAIAAAMVYGVSRVRGMTAEVMVLAGIATLFLFQSLQSLAQYVASPEVLQAMVFWLFGSLLKASWQNVPIVFGLMAVSLLALIPDLWKVTALRLGDARAAAVGINVARLRIKLFTLVTLLTAAAVAFVGTIGFVGLVAPHVARMLVGEDHRVLVPMAAICGAIVMVSASILSKLVSPGAVIPIGIVTAVVGVPFLFALTLSGRRNHWG
ncbi:MAG: iron ABC transporter permease [Pseudomonadota bacterium]